MKIAVGSDHAAYELKEAIKEKLTAEGHEILDMGTRHMNPCTGTARRFLLFMRCCVTGGKGIVLYGLEMNAQCQPSSQTI